MSPVAFLMCSALFLNFSPIHENTLKELEALHAISRGDSSTLPPQIQGAVNGSLYLRLQQIAQQGFPINSILRRTAESPFAPTSSILRPNSTPLSIEEADSEISLFVRGPKFELNIDETNSTSLSPSGNYILVQTTKSLLIYNKRAEKIGEFQHDASLNLRISNATFLADESIILVRSYDSRQRQNYAVGIDLQGKIVYTPQLIPRNLIEYLISSDFKQILGYEFREHTDRTNKQTTRLIFPDSPTRPDVYFYGFLVTTIEGLVKSTRDFGQDRFRPHATATFGTERFVVPTINDSGDLLKLYGPDGTVISTFSIDNSEFGFDFFSLPSFVSPDLKMLVAQEKTAGQNQSAKICVWSDNSHVHLVPQRGRLRNANFSGNNTTLLIEDTFLSGPIKRPLLYIVKYNSATNAETHLGEIPIQNRNIIFTKFLQNGKFLFVKFASDNAKEIYTLSGKLFQNLTHEDGKSPPSSRVIFSDDETVMVSIGHDYLQIWYLRNSEPHKAFVQSSANLNPPQPVEGNPL